jgi:hypothetical protein
LGRGKRQKVEEEKPSFSCESKRERKKYSFTSREKKREKVGATSRSLLRKRKKKAPLWRYRYVNI